MTQIFHSSWSQNLIISNEIFTVNTIFMFNGQVLAFSWGKR